MEEDAMRRLAIMPRRGAFFIAPRIDGRKEFIMEQTKKLKAASEVTKNAAKQSDKRSVLQQLKDCGRTLNLVKIAVLAALGFVLMQVFHIPMPFAPAFMSVDFGDVPGLVGGFAMGPVAGVIIQFVKNFLKLLTTETVGVGELSNFIVSTAFVIGASSYYKRHKTMSGAVVALLIGSIAMTVMALISNAYFIFPAYAKAIDLDLNALAVQVGSANHLVKDYWTLMFFAVVPFNLVKTALESVVCLLLYKRISPILHR